MPLAAKTSSKCILEPVAVTRARWLCVAVASSANSSLPLPRGADLLLSWHVHNTQLTSRKTPAIAAARHTALITTTSTDLLPRQDPRQHESTRAYSARHAQTSLATSHCCTTRVHNCIHSSSNPRPTVCCQDRTAAPALRQESGNPTLRCRRR